MMIDTDKRGAFAMARRLQQALRKGPIHEETGAHLNVNVSWGIAGYPWCGENAADLLQWADAGMYAIKALRRGATLSQAASASRQRRPARAAKVAR
jgi:diguanylate cyclase (GGDEF)-like protein